MVFRPDTFGKYVLLKRIAVGGMAEVFRAKVFGAEGFEKLVAIKRMLSHLSADDQFVGMFVNEAKLTASLTHANIAQIYDFGCIDNLYFLSMEFISGKDVADLIRMLRDRGLMAPVELACHVIIGALNGLDYAHRKTDLYQNPLNLIHRDMSPHNLLISYEGEVKIVDFGIAKAKSTTVKTTGGVLKGKYSYMSPEQAHGMAMDHRTDIFSLGICFYELLTLSKMFHGESDLNVLEKVRETNFVLPRELNPDIPPELQDLLLRALEKNPEDRWNSAAEWREALEGFMFHANLHYSTSWLSAFMTEIFREELDRDLGDLAKEAEVAKDLRTGARRMARLEAIRDTVVLKRGSEPNFASTTGMEFEETRPPIREIESVEFQPEYELDEDELEDDSDDGPGTETARAESPLGRMDTDRGRMPLHAEELDDIGDLEMVDDVEIVDELEDLPQFESIDDDSFPTMELSRPEAQKLAGAQIPARRLPVREVVDDDEVDDDEVDEDEEETSNRNPRQGSEAATLDERSQPMAPRPPIDTGAPEERPGDELMAGQGTGEAVLDPYEFGDGSDTTLNRNRGRRRSMPPEEEATTRGPGGGKTSVWVVVAVLLVALLAGGAVALWPYLMADDGTADPTGDGGPTDGGKIKVAGPALDPIKPDAGQIAKPAEEPRIVKPDAGVKVAAGGDPEPATKPQGGDPVKVAPADPVKVAVVPDKPKPPKKKRKRYRRKRTSSCPSRGWGSLDVGVSGSWAFVFIDGKKIRSTPLIGHRLKAGRHKVELRDQGGGLKRRWKICMKRNGKVKLLHQ